MAAKQQPKKPQRSKAKTYTVQSGDTLTAIAHKTGVPVAELQALNPEIDPQILIAGEVLKLRRDGAPPSPYRWWRFSPARSGPARRR